MGIEFVTFCLYAEVIPMSNRDGKTAELPVISKLSPITCKSIKKLKLKFKECFIGYQKIICIN